VNFTQKGRKFHAGAGKYRVGKPIKKGLVWDREPISRRFYT